MEQDRLFISFDFVKIFKEIDLHKNDLDIDNFMTTIINHCHEIQPNKSWDLFKELDYTAEVKSLAAHVIESLEKEAYPLIEQGFWFGLSDNGYLYFAVSDQYIAEEDNLDWMSEAAYSYLSLPFVLIRILPVILIPNRPSQMLNIELM